MTDAFAATYSDWKVIKGRKVVQLVFELPLEKADEAYQVLGGMPIAAHEVWCGIARLAKGGDAIGAGTSGSRPEAQPRPVAATSAGADKPKSPAQVAGYLCSLATFHAFLMEDYPEDWEACWQLGGKFSDVAAEVVRLRCNVKSRADLTNDNPEWRSLIGSYHAWELAPGVVG